MCWAVTFVVEAEDERLEMASEILQRIRHMVRGGGEEGSCKCK